MSKQSAEMKLDQSSEVSIEEFFEVSRFLNREAGLLDDRRYADWFALLSEDIEYRVPVRRFRQAEGPSDDWAVEKELSPAGDLQMTINGHAQMKVRIERLLSGKAHTENPPWFTQRLITNVDVQRSGQPHELSAQDEAGHERTYEVASKFLLNRFKSGREQTIVGSRRDRILRESAGGGFRLQRREVLLNADSFRWGAYVLI
jgi:3-phenylpropionate/cinnamic acid dioxygenase small subunit